MLPSGLRISAVNIVIVTLTTHGFLTAGEGGTPDLDLVQESAVLYIFLARFRIYYLI